MRVTIARLRRLGLCLVILLISSIIGLVASFMLTPLLWRLEKPLGLELAGHSGPAEWIILSVIGFACLLGLGAWGAAAALKRRPKPPA